MKAIEKYKLDKHSFAVKFMRKNGFFERALESDIDLCDFVGDAKKMGVPLTDYVKQFCEDTTSNEGDEYLSETAAYGMICLKDWCKYQQAYLLSDLMIKDFADKMPADFDEGFLLPFPTIFVALEFKEEKRKIGFFMRQRENGEFDVVAFSKIILTYFPLNDETYEQMSQKRFGGYFADEAKMVLAAYAFFVVAFLSVFREKRKIARVNCILRKGSLRKKQMKASEWKFDDSVIMEKLPSAEVSLSAAFNLTGLIPPDERPEEIVEPKNTHASPRRHHVRTHTCVYWTGPGRKIPVVRVIESYERGGKEEDLTYGAERICRPEK